MNPLLLSKRLEKKKQFNKQAHKKRNSFSLSFLKKNKNKKTFIPLMFIVAEKAVRQENQT